MALSQCLSDPLDWDWDRGGGRGSSSGRSTRISSFGRPAAALAACKPTVSPPFFKKKFLFKAKPRPRNDFCHRTWHWTQQQARIRIIRGCYITGLSCSFLLYTQKAHTSEIVSISTHLCYFPSVKLAFGSCSQDLSVGSLKFKSVQVKSRKPK